MAYAEQSIKLIADDKAFIASINAIKRSLEGLGKSVVSPKIKADTSEINRLGSNIQSSLSKLNFSLPKVDVSSALQGAQSAFSALGSTAISVFSAIGSAATTAFAVISGGVAIIGALTGAFLLSGLKNAASLQTVRTSMEVLTGSAETAKDLMQDFAKVADNSSFGNEQVANAGKTLLGFGRTAEQVKKDIRVLGDIASATGGDFNSLALVYGQVNATGKLMGGDALQLINNNMPITSLIAKKLGVDMGTVRDMMEKGLITADLFNEVLAETTAVGGMAFDAMNKQSKTLAGRLSTAQDGIKNFGLALVGVTKDGEIKIGGLADKVSKFFALFNDPAVQTSLNNLGTALSDAFAELFNVDLGVGAGGIAGFIDGITQSIPGAVKQIKEFQITVQGTFGKIPELINKVKQAFTDLMNKMKPVFDYMNQNARPILLTIGTVLAIVFGPALVALIGGVVGAFAGLIATFIATVAPIIALVAGVYLLWKALENAGVIDWVWQKLQELWKWIVDAAYPAIVKFAGDTAATFQSLWSQTVYYWGLIGATISNFVNMATSTIHQFVVSVIQFFTDLYSNITAKMQEIWKAVVDKFEEIKNKVVEIVKSLIDKIVELFGGLGGAIINVVGSLWDIFGDWVKQAEEIGKSIYDTLFGWISKVQNDIGGAIDSAGNTANSLLKSLGLYGGGLVPSYLAKGGFPGNPKGADRIPVWASPGEYMIKSSSSKTLGRPLLDMLNYNPEAVKNALGNVTSASNSVHRGGDNIANNNTKNVTINMNYGGIANEIDSSKILFNLNSLISTSI